MVTEMAGARNVIGPKTMSRGAGEEQMDWKVRALTAALMTIIMVAIVTFVATWLALGFDPTFLRQWAKAFVVAWPIAAITGFFVMPGARKIAERLVGR